MFCHNRTTRTPVDPERGWGAHSTAILIALALAATIVRSPVATAQDRPDTLGDRVHDYADNEVGRYRITYTDDGVAMKQIPGSLLRWSNATRNVAFGDTYVWTDQGCARAIISIFALGPPRNSIAIECQSLSPRPLTASRDETVVWKPSSPGITLKPIPGARAPASSPVAQAVQMNGLARRFRAEFAPHNTPDEFTQLRLLPKPLFRYDSEDPEVVVGAVYGLVDATDPELLLVIEARRQDGETSWMYSPARSRHDHLRLYLDSDLVWDSPRLAPPWENIRDPSKPYFNLRLDKLASERQKIMDLFSEN